MLLTQRSHPLDGLRGIAVLLIYFVHFCGSYMVYFRGGNPNSIPLADWLKLFDKILYWLFWSHHGVYLFFIISGFLIGRIVFAPTFSYPDFVLRRLLRIYPAFLLALAISILAGRYAFGIPMPSGFVVIGNLFFLNGAPGFSVSPIVANNVTWSLFYEFVFYLVFPLLVLCVPATHFLRAALIGAVIAAIIFISGRWVGELFIFMPLFAGALLACINRDTAASIMGRIPSVAVVAVYLAATTSWTFGWISFRTFYVTFTCAGTLIVASAIYGTGWFPRFLAAWPLSQLGRVSYSFYLLHSFGLGIVFAFGPAYLSLVAAPGLAHATMLGLTGFAISLVLSVVSFAVAEKFYFSLPPSKRKLAPVVSSSVIAPATTKAEQSARKIYVP